MLIVRGNRTVIDGKLAGESTKKNNYTLCGNAVFALIRAVIKWAQQGMILRPPDYEAEGQRHKNTHQYPKKAVFGPKS